MQNKKISNVVLITAAICLAASFLGQVFEKASLTKMAYILSLVLIFSYYFLGNYFSKIMGIVISLTMVSVLFVTPVFDDPDFFSHILITLCTFMCIDMVKNVTSNIKTNKVVTIIFFIVSIILVFSYYFGPLKTSYFEHTDSISLNFYNPNVAGLWLACIFIMLFFFAFYQKKKVWRVIFLVISISVLPIVIATQSRNSYLACIFFAVGMLCSKFFKVKKVPNFVLLILTILPIIVFFFYMLVIVENKAYWEGIFAFKDIDKGISTREGVWKVVLNDFQHCFWIGDYRKYYDWHMHNSLMTIYCRFGMGVTFFVCLIIYRTLKRLQERYSFVAALSLASILFTGCFEASIFLGVSGLYLMLLIIPSCVGVEEKTADNDLQGKLEEVSS